MSFKKTYYATTRDGIRVYVNSVAEICAIENNIAKLQEIALKFGPHNIMTSYRCLCLGCHYGNLQVVQYFYPLCDKRSFNAGNFHFTEVLTRLIQDGYTDILMWFHKNCHVDITSYLLNKMIEFDKDLMFDTCLGKEDIRDNVDMNVVLFCIRKGGMKFFSSILKKINMKGYVYEIQEVCIDENLHDIFYTIAEKYGISEKNIIKILSNSTLENNVLFSFLLKNDYINPFSIIEHCPNMEFFKWYYDNHCDQYYVDNYIFWAIHCKRHDIETFLKSCTNNDNYKYYEGRLLVECSY